MTAAEYHLKLAIWHWCGVTPDKYVPDSELRAIWAGNVPGQILYEGEGIRRLFVKLYGDPFFAQCPSAHNLRPGEFVKGGDLQTVMELYKRFLACGNIPISPTSEGKFELSPTSEGQVE